MSYEAVFQCAIKSPRINPYPRSKFVLPPTPQGMAGVIIACVRWSRRSSTSTTPRGAFEILKALNDRSYKAHHHSFRRMKESSFFRVVRFTDGMRLR